jgi:uncharacterized membrane protein
MCITGTILIVLIAGAIARNYIGRKLLSFGEGLISKIPFARTIYTATKQIIETLFVSTEFKGISRAVMFEYPRDIFNRFCNRGSTGHGVRKTTFRHISSYGF